MPESLLLPLPCQPTPSLVLYDCAWPEGPPGSLFVPSHIHSGQPPFPVRTPFIPAASPLSTSLCHSPCVSGGLFSYPFPCPPAAPPPSRRVCVWTGSPKFGEEEYRAESSGQEPLSSAEVTETGRQGLGIAAHCPPRPSAPLPPSWV